jgi:15-cis-phytoene synthase
VIETGATRRHPGRPDPAVAALLPKARATMRRVARTFAVAARLLPGSVRDDVELLYLVLRSLDDLVDLEAADPDDASASGRLAAVEAWAAGQAPAAPTQETLILDDLARRHPALPRDAVADFTLGMRQDLAGPAIITEADLDEYCDRVAGTVGRLMASILGAVGPEADGAARALGNAMQRTNVLRDIDEDLDRGRCYLPAETLAAHGIVDLRIDDRRPVLRAEIALADADYERGMAGIPLLRHGRRSITAAALMYREILRQIERDGLGARRPHRSVVSRPRTAILVARAAILPGSRRPEPGRPGPATTPD